MRQYHELLTSILEKGTYKEPARENMPGTTSLFGHQIRFDLSEGFPILTTKKISFKNVVVELLWFLKGDTNIKYLVDNGCNIWNEDAYNYYLKRLRQSESNRGPAMILEPYTFEEFTKAIKDGNFLLENRVEGIYKLGDCGVQYGKLWRDWRSQPIFGDGGSREVVGQGSRYISGQVQIDQLKELIEGLKKNPMSRRHIITAWNPATLDDMALNACHAFVQFNCRPLSLKQRMQIAYPNGAVSDQTLSEVALGSMMDHSNIPKYKLDCQLYQRSADVFLGVPYNISSYALLTEILAKVCNMVPGEFVHTFGDVHIYDNHMDQVGELLKRTPTELPKLKFSSNTEKDYGKYDFLVELLPLLNHYDFSLENYNSQSTIKAELSTGLKKI